MTKWNKLEEITRNTVKKIKFKPIVMPSDYIKVFKDEIKNFSTQEPVDLDLNIFIKNEVELDLNKSISIIKETEELLKAATKIIEKSEEAIHKENNLSLDNAKKEISLLLSKIGDLSLDLYTDELTGVLNRKWFFREFLKDEKYPKTNGVIAFIDLNKLKEINDSFGHKVGDKAIIFFADFVKKYFKNHSFVRFAGDEFIIILENEKEKNIFNKLLKSKEELKKIRLKTYKDGETFYLNLSFSFGIAEYFVDIDIMESIDKADHSMYIMKKMRK